MSVCMGPGCTHPDHGHRWPTVDWTPPPLPPVDDLIAGTAPQLQPARPARRATPKPTRAERRAAAKARRSR